MQNAAYKLHCTLPVQSAQHTYFIFVCVCARRFLVILVFACAAILPKHKQQHSRISSTRAAPAEKVHSTTSTRRSRRSERKRYSSEYVSAPFRMARYGGCVLRVDVVISFIHIAYTVVVAFNCSGLIGNLN